MTDSTPTVGRGLMPVRGRPDGPVLAWGRLLDPDERSLFDDPNLPSFKLDGAEDLLAKMLAEEQTSSGTKRLLVSAEQQKALAQGALELVRNADGNITGQLRDATTKRFAGHAAFVQGASVLAGPHAAVAVLAIAALSEMGEHLAAAFAVVTEQLNSINSKLDAAFQRSVSRGLSGASSCLETAQEAQGHLTREGRIPTAVALGNARLKAREGWTQAVAEFHALEKKLGRLTATPCSAPRYLEVVKTGLPHGAYELAGVVSLLSAWGVARIQCERAYEMEVAVPGDPIARQSLAMQEVLDVWASTGLFLQQLSLAEFTESTKHPRHVGFFEKSQSAARVHFDILRIQRDAAEVRVMAERALDTSPVAIELRREGDSVVARSSTVGQPLG